MILDVLIGICDSLLAKDHPPGSIRPENLALVLERTLERSRAEFPAELQLALRGLETAYGEPRKGEAVKLAALHNFARAARAAANIEEPEPTVPVRLNLEETGWLCYLLLGRIGAMQEDTATTESILGPTPEGMARIEKRMRLLYEKIAAANDVLMGKA